MSNEIKTVLDDYPDFEANIGVEIHVQLKTSSKMFCSCPNRFGDTPNRNICHVCSGQPGSLPVVNRRAVDFAIMAGLATNCKITRMTEFSRKHYMYPDLPKNFQITQNERPICEEGYVPIDLPDGQRKKVRLIRIHMEEDAGKNIHDQVADESLVDLNRAGTPLIEMVSYPDIFNAYEAKAFLTRVRSIVQYLNISDASMEEGSFRVDTNISVKKKGDKNLGVKVELKNINSFKFICHAIDYEIDRQITLIKEGGTVAQETRLWNPKKQETVSMRSKEEAHDYRYFTEPDIPVIIVDDQWIEKIEKEIPELPHDKLHRFQEELGLSAYEAAILTDQVDIADFFEKATKLSGKPKQISNWVLRDLFGYLKNNKVSLAASKITPEMFAEFVTVLEEGIINTKVAQDVFIEMVETGKYPSIIIQEKDLKQISSEEELEKIVLGIIENNQEAVKKYREGNERLLPFFVGQTMKATKGKGNPKVIQELLKKHL